MTKKDYVRIAAAIKLARGAGDSTGHFLGCFDVARVMAETLAQDNARFDKARFMEACGVMRAGVQS
jgi:hypothetical protein